MREGSADHVLDVRSSDAVHLENDLLGTFVALMPDAAVVVNQDGVIVCVNEQTDDIFGYSSLELVGRPVELLVPERFRSGHRQHRQRYGEAPHARTMGAGRDLVGRRRDGDEVAVDISLAPLGVTDQPLVVVSIRDATERRQAQAAQAQLAAVVRSSRDAILSMTLEGRILTCNPGAEALFGYEPDGLIGAHISRLVPEDASPELERHLEAALAGTSLGPFDTWWLTREGERRPVAASVSPLGAPSEDPIGFSVVVRDITERKRAEAEQQRLLAEVRRQERFQASQSEIRLAIISESPLVADLELICNQLGELLDVSAAAALLFEGGPRIVAGAGSAAPLAGRVLEALPEVLAAAASRDALQHLPTGLPDDGPDPAVTAVFGGRPLVVAPMHAEDEVMGLVVVAAGSAVASPEYVIIESMSKQGSLALELDRARRYRERLAVAEDRERIARDLHDQVIQRLFAAGMSLQAVQPRIADPSAAERVEEIVEGLDEAIREIRTAIFRLGSAPRSHSLRAQILEAAEEASRALGFSPKVVFDGPVDTTVPGGVYGHVLAVVREALTNAARHAHATQVVVEITVDRQICVVVCDNGVGLGPTDRRSGLANLDSRAGELGGQFIVSPNPGGGTRIDWRVPLDG